MNITIKFVVTAVIITCFLASGSIRLHAADSAPITVIVSSDSSVTNISDRQLRRLFLGKSIKLPNGNRAVLATYTPAMSRFNKQALKRTNAQVSSAWSRLKFSGRTLEPKIFDNPAQLMDFIASTPNAIGYISSNQLSNRVRAIHSID